VRKLELCERQAVKPWNRQGLGRSLQQTGIEYKERKRMRNQEMEQYWYFLKIRVAHTMNACHAISKYQDICLSLGLVRNS